MNTDCLAGSMSREVGFQVSPIIGEQLHWSNLNNLGGILIIEICGGFLLDLSHPPGAHSRTTRNFVTVAPLPFSTSPTHMAAGPYKLQVSIFTTVSYGNCNPTVSISWSSWLFGPPATGSRGLYYCGSTQLQAFGRCGSGLATVVFYGIVLGTDWNWVPGRGLWGRGNLPGLASADSRGFAVFKPGHGPPGSTKDG